MNKGEIWISKTPPLEDEFWDALRLLDYDGDDLWTIETGYIEDDVFIEDDLNCESGMLGEDIFENFKKTTGAYT